MTKKGWWLGIIPALVVGCAGVERYSDEPVEIPQFEFASATEFAPLLSDYNLFAQVNLAGDNPLVPNPEWHLLELSSPLYTDHAYKQRLVKLPEGTQITVLDDEMPNFPDGTILAKSFYYLADERSASSTKQVLETRLLIKEQGLWSAATYVWNEAQTDAALDIDGLSTQVSWIDKQGERQSIRYQVPSQNDCAACHQLNSKLTPLGPSIRNLNRDVTRQGDLVSQLAYLHQQGLLDKQPSAPASMVDYTDTSIASAERARAYLAMNCSHCHRPGAWDATADRPLDFRYQIPLADTGLRYSEEKITRVMQNGEMPFIGTITIHSQGVALVTTYLDSIKAR